MAHILVIDDDRDLRRALRRTLEASGHVVTEAESSARGLDLYRKSRPDVVMTDVHMPEGDGVEGTVKMLAEFPDARVIVMSGGGWASPTAVLEEASKLGAAGTLPKPFTGEEVVTTLQRVLEGQVS
jgi:DNA-binding NtrC family response regulator